MPLHDWKCSCGIITKDVYRKSSDLDRPERCPACDGVMHRLPALFHSDMVAFHRPIEMFSIASEDPAEIRRMKEAGVEVSDDPTREDYGVPIARTRKDKLRALKAVGFVETK